MEHPINGLTILLTAQDDPAFEIVMDRPTPIRAWLRLTTAVMGTLAPLHAKVAHVVRTDRAYCLNAAFVAAAARR